MSILDIISAILGLTCVFLAGKGRVLNFWFGYLYNIFLFFLFLDLHLYSSMILQPISFVINCVGHYRWTHPKEGEKDSEDALMVTSLSKVTRGLYIVGIAVISIGWGYLLRNGSEIYPDFFAPAARPFLDSFVTIMILTAQYLSAQKKIECWAAWTVVNVAQIVLYILSGLYFMPVVSVAYLILAFVGFKAWKKSKGGKINADN